MQGGVDMRWDTCEMKKSLSLVHHFGIVLVQWHGSAGKSYVIFVPRWQSAYRDGDAVSSLIFLPLLDRATLIDYADSQKRAETWRRFGSPHASAVTPQPTNPGRGTHYGSAPIPIVVLCGNLEEERQSNQWQGLSFDSHQLDER